MLPARPRQLTTPLPAGRRVRTPRTYIDSPVADCTRGRVVTPLHIHFVIRLRCPRTVVHQKRRNTIIPGSSGDP